MAKGGILIGELARRTGCNIETIRYYERIGVLPTPERKGRYRCYRVADARRLVFLRRARGLGFSLDEVRALLRLAVADGRSACRQVRQLASDHLTEVRTKISALKAMEFALADAVQRCDDGERPGCPLIDALSS
jgi:MerR family mercuric resistance operon transcriptional regulator